MCWKEFSKKVWHSMTFEVILLNLKILSLHNVSSHINFWYDQILNQSEILYKRWHYLTFRPLSYLISIHVCIYINRLINECARNNLAKILESQNHEIPESRSFLWDVEDLVFKWNKTIIKSLMFKVIIMERLRKNKLYISLLSLYNWNLK